MCLEQQPDYDNRVEGTKVSRRFFLKLAGLAGAGILAELAVQNSQAYTLEFLRLLNEDKLARKCNEYIRNHESLRQYKTVNCQGLVPRNDEYALIIQNPSSGVGKHRLAFSEGESPTLCLINEDGVCDYSRLNEVLDPEKIENLSDAGFLTSMSLDEIRSTTLQVNEGHLVETILILGDSWVRWNGLEASYPAMLQTLCDASGKQIRVVDGSATSLGVADYRYQYDRLKRQYYPSKVVWTYHPNTDARYDVKRAQSSYDAQRATIGEVGGLQDPSPIKHAATNLLRRWEDNNYNLYTTLKSLAKRVIKGSASDSLITNEELHAYITQMSELNLELEQDKVTSILLGLPAYDLGRLDKHKYLDIWEQIANVQMSMNGQCINSHDIFKSSDFDEYNHPTFVGSLKLAIDAYVQIFGEHPSQDVVVRAIELHSKRRSAINKIRNSIMNQ